MLHSPIYSKGGKNCEVFQLLWLGLWVPDMELELVGGEINTVQPPKTILL